MANENHGLRQCPTRIDGSGVLFAHKVNQAQCQDRQRGRYHKCFTCAFNNAYVAVHGMPDPDSVVVATTEDPSDQAESIKFG